jgi:uncharacterized protein (TIGR02246 family)
MRALALALIVFAVPVAAQTITGGTAAEVAALSARKQAVIDAYNAQDINALAANYTSDAWHISPRRPPAVGREAIAQFFVRAMPIYTMTSIPKVLSVDIEGATATMISASTLVGAPRAGVTGRDGAAPPAFTEVRTNMTVFKKQPDGQWLIHRFIDTPPPETPETPK